MPRPTTGPPWQRFLPELVVVILGLVLVIGLWINNNDSGSLGGGAALPPGATTTVAPSGGTTPLIADGEVTIDGDANAAKGIRGAVLRADDLPKGWTASGVTSGDNPLCEDDPVSLADPIALVRSGFRRPSSGDLISGTVAVYEDAATAHRVLEGLAAGRGGCGSKELGYRFAGLDDVGDEGVRVSVDVAVGSTKIRNLALVARRGERIAIVSATGDPIDEALVLRALQAEVGRL